MGGLKYSANHHRK